MPDDREYHETAALPWRNEILSSAVVLTPAEQCEKLPVRSSV
jgi:hypothetical protein